MNLGIPYLVRAAVLLAAQPYLLKLHGRGGTYAIAGLAAGLVEGSHHSWRAPAEFVSLPFLVASRREQSPADTRGREK